MNFRLSDAAVCVVGHNFQLGSGRLHEQMYALGTALTSQGRLAAQDLHWAFAHQGFPRPEGA